MTDFFLDHARHCEVCATGLHLFCETGMLLKSWDEVDHLRQAGIADLVQREKDRPKSFEELFRSL